MVSKRFTWRLEERMQNPDPAISSANDLASTAAREVAKAKTQIDKLTKKVQQLEEATLEPAETVDDPPPVQKYAQGSWGPEEASKLVRGHADWHQPWLPGNDSDKGGHDGSH